MHQPHLAWYPLGVTCEWQLNPSLAGCRFRMLFSEGDMAEEKGAGRSLQFDTAYLLRLRVAPEGSSTGYAIRAWEDGTDEPQTWDLDALKVLGDVLGVAAAVLAHNTDATFGETVATPL